MTRLKKPYIIVFLVLIAVSNYMLQLAADDINDEGKSAVFQEFIKMATDLEKQNKINEAIDIYERIIKADPNNLESHKKIAALYTRSSQHENAAQTWEKLLEIDPDSPEYQDNLINSLRAADKLDEAIEIIRSSIQMQPDNGIHYGRLTRLYADTDNEDEAIKNYEKAIKLGYNDKDMNLKIAELYFVKGNLEGSENALKNAILTTASDWERQRIERRLINLYRYQGNLEQKLLLLDENTISLEMQKARAEHFLNTDEVEKATEAYKLALEMTNENPYERNRITKDLLKSYIKQNRADIAIEFYETEAMKLPRYSTVTSTYSSSGITVRFGGDDARNSLINAYKDQGKLDELTTIFKDKLDKDANNPLIIEMLAEIYWKTEDYPKAAETYELLSQREPENIRSLYLAAIAYKKSNQPEKSKELLNKAGTALSSSRHKNDTSFLAAMATTCQKNKMYDTGIKLIKDAITVIEKREDKWGIEYYYNILAKCYQGAKQYEEAYKVNQKVLKHNEYDYMKREVESEMKKIAKDGKLYEKWIPEQIEKVKENPNDIELIIELAENYEAYDKIEEAITQYERLVELDSENPKWYKKLGHLYQTMLPKRQETGEVHEGFALTLSGNGSFVEIDDSLSLDKITDQVTVSAWIKPTHFPNNYLRIIFRSDEQKQNYRQRSYILAIRSDGKLKIASSPRDGGYASLYSKPGLIKLNRWTHIAGVIDSKKDSMKVFVDGINVGNRHFNGQVGFVGCQLPLRIGVTHIKEQVQDTSFIGQIDEVRVWNIPRTEAEIRADMNKRLNGDEPSLVGYWKFDEEKDGRIFDSTRNKNDGNLYRDAKIESYSRAIYERSNSEQLERSITSYQIAIGLEPKSYQLYDRLAQTFVLAGQTAKAEETYQKALDEPLKLSDHNSAIRAISKLYTGDGNDEKLIAILERIESQIQNSVFLYKLLGDLYKQVGETDKAEIAYGNWMKIRQKAVTRQNSEYQYRRFADELLNKGIYPETALLFARRAFYKNSYFDESYPATVGLACIQNGLYEDALKYFKYGFTVISDESSFGRFWGRITDYGKKVNDKRRFYEMMEVLADSIPSGYKGHRIEVNRILVKLRLAEYYSQNNMQDEAKVLIDQTGIVDESAWFTLGPFDNTAGIGYNTEYIKEDSPQIDLNTQYEGVNEQIQWQKFSDKTFDGYIDFSSRGDWRVSYAWTTITSPDERPVQFRFDSDDQGKLWLNGDEIYANDQHKIISLDREIIPVTLKAGKNTILVKVCNEEDESGLYLRITDSDGKPIKDLITNDIQDN